MNLAHLSKHSAAKKLLPDEMPVSFKPRLKLWYRLQRAAFDEYPHYVAARKDIRTAAKLLCEWRNNLAHGWITVEPDGLRIVTSRPGAPHKLDVYSGIQHGELVTLANDIKRLRDELHALDTNQFMLRTHLVKPKR
jgi:hypothetical protein